MTYNPDEWELGDVALIEFNPDFLVLAEESKEKIRTEPTQLFFCCQRTTRTGSRTVIAWQGRDFYVMRNMRNHSAVVSIQRMHVVDPIEFNERERINNVPIVQGTNLRITVPADSPATFNHALRWSVDLA